MRRFPLSRPWWTWLKALGGTTGVVGCIDLEGEPRLFNGRKASAAELEWMALALVGSGYSGICWRGAASPEADQLFAQMVRNLRHHATALTDARPAQAAVSVASSVPGVPISCLRGSETIFIVLLRPDLMHAKGRQGTPLAPDPPDVQGSVSVALAAGETPVRATTLSGFRMDLKRSGTDGTWTIPYAFSGGGLMIVVELRPPESHEAPAKLP